MRRTHVFLLSMSLLFFTSRVLADMSRYAQSLCDKPDFFCVKVKRGETWENMFPDEGQRELVMRLNRMNTRVFRGLTIAVPKDLTHVTEIELSPFDHKLPPSGQKFVYVDPKLNAWGAYDEQGNLVRWGPASTGRDWCGDVGRPCHTVTGQFTVYQKGGENCVSSKFPVPDGGAPMPFCMYFHGGFALHGSSEVEGYNASHGCVRIFYNDADWLNHEFVEVGTKVIVAPYAINVFGKVALEDPEQEEYF